MKTLLPLFLLASITAYGQNLPPKGSQTAQPCNRPNGDLCLKNTCDKPITVTLSRGQILTRTIDLLKGQESCMYDLQEGGYTYVAREKNVGSGWNSQGAAGLSKPFTNEVKVKKCEEVKVEIPNFLE
jgi:hypothetical protein